MKKKLNRDYKKQFLLPNIVVTIDIERIEKSGRDRAQKSNWSVIRILFES